MSEVESEGIYSNLSLFDVPVDTGTQNIFACLSMLGSTAEIKYLNSYDITSYSY